MATTSRQDAEFIDHMIDTNLLENAISWIARNLNPGDVFPDGDLEEWAEENGYVKAE